VESKLGPLGTSAIVPAPGDCEDGEFGGMNGRGNRSTQRKPAPAPHWPPQIPLDQTRDWTRAAAVGSQRLTASAMARPRNALLYLLWYTNSERELLKVRVPPLFCFQLVASCTCPIAITPVSTTLKLWTLLNGKEINNQVETKHRYLPLSPWNSVRFNYI
jgi:hypothetical protein